MSTAQSDLPTTKPPQAKGVWGAVIFLLLFGTPFLVLGGAGAIKGFQSIAAGRTKDWPLAVLGPFFACIGLLAYIGAFFVPRTARRDAELHAKFPNQPWLWKSDWASKRIRESAAVVWWIWIIAGIWNTFSLGALAANPRDRHGNEAPMAVLAGF